MALDGMEVRLDRGKRIVQDATDQIFGRFEELMADWGFNSLEELADSGYPLAPHDLYLFELSAKLTERGALIFSPHEQEQLKEVIRDIHTTEPMPIGYLEVLSALQSLDSEIEAEKIKQGAIRQARNIRAAKVAGLFNAGTDPEKTAFNRVRGMPFFVTEVASRLTNQPRATRESLGGIGPVMANLRMISRGEVPAPIGSRRTRRNRSRSSRSGSRSSRSGSRSPRGAQAAAGSRSRSRPASR